MFIKFRVEGLPSRDVTRMMENQRKYRTLTKLNLLQASGGFGRENKIVAATQFLKKDPITIA